MSSNVAKRQLLLAVGNRSRGDDAAGPLLLDRLRSTLADLPDDSWQIEECYQLQPELVEQMRCATAVWIVDATREFCTGTELVLVSPARQFEFTTHALSASSLLALYAKVYRCPPPATRLLKIGATQFALGTPCCHQTQLNINAAAALFQCAVARELPAGRASAGGGNRPCTS